MLPSLMALPAAAATLYSQPAYQSPVRGEPDELLLLPGRGFAAGDVVVYQSIADTTKPLVAPGAIPKASTASLGLASVIGSANLPDSLTVKLPAALKSGQSYALWVVDKKNQWSNGIKMNDARPLWLTPSHVYETAALASLPRYLKVVGRNLQPSAGGATRVKLVNADPAKPSISLEAANDGDPATSIEHYVAKVDLPARLLAGEYSLQVSRDGVSWVAVDQNLTVRPDPPSPREFAVANYGCAPDDGKDDVRCVKEAIKDASQAAAGGATVVFDAGTWNLSDSTGNEYRAGIVVPVGVNLRGTGAATTTLMRGAQWGSQDGRGPNPTFSLLGQNRVEGITFKEARVYSTAETSQNTALQLGKTWYALGPNDPRVVRDVVISKNVFDKPYRAIASGGLPAQQVVVTYNEFGAFDTALMIDGDDGNMKDRFRFDDAIVAFNTFKPGSYQDVSIGQGTIASQIGASRRLDFSNNTADGASTEYLNEPRTDARGWRAAYFWHMQNNHEMALVSQNTASCTGDKAGDGEGFAFDDNHNTFGFSKAQDVVSATATTVKVHGPLRTRQGGKALPDDYYNEHWVQIAQGTGVGQVRRVASYASDGSGVTLTVTPAWDVVPQAGSRLALGREFWQLYVVDNTVDHRAPLCLKSNRKAQANQPIGGGVITLWAQAADSSIEGNQQYDSLGIVLHPAYSAEDSACPDCKSWTFLQYFIDVRGNTIDHEYDWNSDCSWSGITLSQGESPTPGSPPPVTAYGVNIARNTIIQADGMAGGAISMVPTWWDGPAPGGWKVVNNTLIQHNIIQALQGAAPAKKCAGSQQGRTGIVMKTPTAANTILYANDCATRAATRLADGGTKTVKISDPTLVKNCESP